MVVLFSAWILPTIVVLLTSHQQLYAVASTHCELNEARFNGQPPYRVRGDELHAHERLGLDEVLVSKNKRHMVTLQTDGNLVCYDRDGRVRFNTGTHGIEAKELELHSDGRVILWKRGRRYTSEDYDQNLISWQSEFSEPGLCAAGGGRKCSLVMQNDGNLVAYKWHEPIKAIFSWWHHERNVKQPKRDKRSITRLIDNVVGFTSSIVTFYDFSKHRVDTQLSALQDAMSQMSRQFQSLHNEVLKERASVKLAEQERIIQNCFDASEDLVKWPNNTDFRRDVIKKCDHLEDALKAISFSLIGPGVFGSDLLEATFKNVKGNSKDFLKRINAIQQLLAIGSAVAPIYFQTMQATVEKRKSFEDWLWLQDSKIRCRMKFDYEPKMTRL